MKTIVDKNIFSNQGKNLGKIIIYEIGINVNFYNPPKVNISTFLRSDIKDDILNIYISENEDKKAEAIELVIEHCFNDLKNEKINLIKA
jgi:hypothetical protein